MSTRPGWMFAVGAFELSMFVTWLALGEYKTAVINLLCAVIHLGAYYFWESLP